MSFRTFKWIKWVVCVACLAAFVWIGLDLNAMTAADSAVYGALSGLISPAMTTLALVCTNLAGPIPLLVITLLAVLLIPRKEYRIPLLLNLSIEVLLNLELKNLFTRPRPAETVRLAVETGFSFPSGHAMAAACFYGFFIYLVWKLCKRKGLRLLLTALLSFFILAVAASRVYLGVHYFSDVLGGLCVSAGYLIVFTSFVDLFFAQGETANLLSGRAGRGRLRSSFAYALEGIAAGVKSERNMVIHFAAVAVVVVFGALLQISRMEWLVCVVLFGCVLTAEMLNTAVETVVNMVCPRIDPKAKLAKDVSAGAVLFMALAAAIAGCVIFLPKLWGLAGTL